MTIQSPSPRLRLFVLSLSLFSIWAIASVSRSMVISAPQNATETSPSGVEVASAKWTRVLEKPPRQLTSDIPPENVRAVDNRNNNTSPAGPLPTPRPYQPDPRERVYYVYSAELINHGEKNIKAVAWDYVFSDKTTHEELKRQLGFTPGPGRGQKKTVKITTPSSPPNVISAIAAASTEPAFAELVIIQCVLFSDGSVWQHPRAAPESCERLRKSRPLPNGIRSN
jgi:hypothetical protein